MTFSIRGAVIPYGDLVLSDVDVALYRMIDDSLEETAYQETNPDATTGKWSFLGLPTSYDYYILFRPPEGYESKILGPYAYDQD